MGNPNSKSSVAGNSLTSSINFINSQSFSNVNNSGKSINKEPEVLTNFSWRNGGKQVLLTGSFDRWMQTIPLEPHQQQFSITIMLPRGLHYYKFIVDGQWRYAPDKPYMIDKDYNINNYIDTTNFHTILEEKKSSSEEIIIDNRDTNLTLSEQALKSVEQFKNEAPILSPHYYHCLFMRGQSSELKQYIKTQTLQQQSKILPNKHQMQDQLQERTLFEKNLTNEQLRYLFNSYHCLPPPTHSSLTHLITQKPNNNNYTSMAVIQRFKQKYTTYKYFLPLNNIK